MADIEQKGGMLKVVTMAKPKIPVEEPARRAIPNVPNPLEMPEETPTPPVRGPVRPIREPERTPLPLRR